MNNEIFYDNIPANFDGKFNWDYLKTSFGRFNDIEPMDIDGCVERNGKVLMFETKTTGKSIPKGQQMTLNAFHNMGCTIIFIWMDALSDDCGYPVKDIDNITKIQIWRPNQNVKTIQIDNGKTFKQVLYDKCAQWYKTADSNKPLEFTLNLE